MKRLSLLLLLGLALAPEILAAQMAQDAVRQTAQGLMLDFQDADLRVVIAALAEAGGLNVVYADLPQKRVTLRNSQPIDPKQIAALLRSLAESNGLTVREEASFFRIDAPASPSATRPAAQQANQPEEETRLFVYRLKHVRAPRLAATLQALFGGGTQVAASGLSRAPLSQRMREGRLQPADSSARPQVDVSVRDVRPSLPGQLAGEVQIVPDETSNSLLIRAQQSDYEIIRAAVDALDLRPLQVLIEVTIAEVRRTKELNVGVSGKSDSRSGRTRGELTGNAPDDFLVRLKRGGSVDIDIALAALSGSGEVRILSRPVVLAQNNQEARILIGAERPFVQVFRSLPTDAGVRDQIVQYRDVGTALTILPTINADGYVNLQVSQEVSTATSETQFGAPVISTREAATHLFARNGQTVVIGGLIDRQQDRTRSGIPLLKEIPLLGVLFGSTRVIDGNSELFLFLTPHIIESDDDADRLRREVATDAGSFNQKASTNSVFTPLRPDTVRNPRPDSVRIPPQR